MQSIIFMCMRILFALRMPLSHTDARIFHSATHFNPKKEGHEKEMTEKVITFETDHNNYHYRTVVRLCHLIM